MLSAEHTADTPTGYTQSIQHSIGCSQWLALFPPRRVHARRQMIDREGCAGQWAVTGRGSSRQQELGVFLVFL